MFWILFQAAVCSFTKRVVHNWSDFFEELTAFLAPHVSIVVTAYKVTINSLNSLTFINDLGSYNFIHVIFFINVWVFILIFFFFSYISLKFNTLNNVIFAKLFNNLFKNRAAQTITNEFQIFNVNGVVFKYFIICL